MTSLSLQMRAMAFVFGLIAWFAWIALPTDFLSQASVGGWILAVAAVIFLAVSVVMTGPRSNDEVHWPFRMAVVTSTLFAAGASVVFSQDSLSQRTELILLGAVTWLAYLMGIFLAGRPTFGNRELPPKTTLALVALFFLVCFGVVWILTNVGADAYDMTEVRRLRSLRFAATASFGLWAIGTFVLLIAPAPVEKRIFRAPSMTKIAILIALSLGLGLVYWWQT